MCWIYQTNTISLLRITHVRDIHSITSSIFNWQGKNVKKLTLTPCHISCGIYTQEDKEQNGETP